MTGHYTALLTTDQSCIDGDYCDVTVLTDEIMGYRLSEDREDYDRPLWESTGPQMYSAPTTVRIDGDHDDAIKDATSILAIAGWTVTSTWESVPTGYCATVERHNQ